MKELIFRTTIALLAGIGVLGAGRISIAQWTGNASCPRVGFLPVCYLILVGYSLIVLSMYPRLQKTSLLFLTGYVPVIFFAITGVVGELTGILQCPNLKNGTPTCYISAALALIIGSAGWFLFKSRKTDSVIKSKFI